MSKVDPFEPHNKALAEHDMGAAQPSKQESQGVSEAKKAQRVLLHGNDIYSPPPKDKKGCKRCGKEKSCKPKKEKVDHPSHYNTGRIEVIDAIEDWNLGFNDGNAIKYIARHQYKGNPIQDIEKAIWYLQRHLDNLKRRGQ